MQRGLEKIVCLLLISLMSQATCDGSRAEIMESFE